MIGEIKIILNNKNIILINNINKVTSFTIINFKCGHCNFIQSNNWIYINRDNFCKYYNCKYYHKIKTLDINLIKTWFLFEKYIYINHTIKLNKLSESIFELYCPNKHKINISLTKWKNDINRCNMCNFYNFYKNYDCSILFDNLNNINITSGIIIPYVCKNNHFINNLTKNNFNNRINNGLNPCSICYKNNVLSNKILNLKNKLNNNFISLFDNIVKYKCIKCSSIKSTKISNVLNTRFTGVCCTCANPFNLKEIQDKIKNTILLKYNVANVMFDDDIFLKNLKNKYKKKIYSFPSGKTVFIQGYEHFCLNELLHIYNENNIFVNIKDMPKFYYKYNNTKHRYYPDIMIKDIYETYFIEVKSNWTYNLDLNKNICKWRCVINSGFDLIIFIYDSNGIPISIISINEILQKIENSQMTVEDIRI